MKMLKDFFLNTVLANFAPDWLLCWYYDRKMKAATGDLNKIYSYWAKYLKDEIALMANIHPSKKTKYPVVVMISGLPMTGKTTVAMQIADLGFFHIDANLVREWLHLAGCSYKYDRFIAISYMEYVLSLGHSVVCDSDHILPIKQAMVKAVARRATRGGLAFEFIKVGSIFSIWEEMVRGLDISDFTPIYAYALNRDLKPVSFKNLREVVVAEYNRQEGNHLMHSNRKVGNRSIYIPNSSSLTALQENGKKVAEEIVRYHKK